jgi:methylmalonyl-CoA mutase N-terminal domain/subunit
MQLRFHAQTGGSTLTAQQPENNVARVALQALAAVLGGAQSLHTNGMDEALGLPTEKAASVALRTQQILAHESGVGDTVDPLGGSYYVEALTSSIEERVWAYLIRIDELGGTIRAIEAGFQQKEIQEAAYTYQRQVDEGHRIVVGVNRFKDEGEDGGGASIPILKIDPRLEEEQRARLVAFRQRRAQGPVDSALASVQNAARAGANLLPHIVGALEARATLGEISGRLRDVLGSYRPTTRV